jgi:hypothetical protein
MNRESILFFRQLGTARIIHPGKGLLRICYVRISAGFPGKAAARMDAIGHFSRARIARKKVPQGNDHLYATPP